MNIVTLCGLGVGSSLMLKMTVEEILEEEGIKGRVENLDLGSAKAKQADLYVVSKDMETNLRDVKGKIIFIENLTDKEEVRKKFLEIVK